MSRKNTALNGKIHALRKTDEEKMENNEILKVLNTEKNQTRIERG